MNHILSLIFSSLAWQRLAKALVFAVLALSISACSILDDDDDDDANKAPTSNAGEDQSVAEGTAVTLDGSGSSDSDGEIESYAWTLTTSNDAVTLSGEDTATASFTAPDVDADTDLVFRLTVTDNDGATATDEVTITVTDNSPGGGENAAPTANAGQDQKVDEGDEVTLAGSGSDSDGTIASYEWALTTTNDDVTLSGADTATASFTAPDVDADTALVFRLTVTDNDGATATDEVTITVTDNSTGGGENAAPTANAGQDQKVDEGDEVTLAGSGSDSDGTIASYAWALTTANDDVTLSGADTATASFTAPDVDADTALVFRLTVTDDDGATATDDVTITVTDTSSGGGGGENAAPTANAGDDQEVDEGDEVTLAGSGSDSDGTIASYEWTHTTSNDGVELSGADTATASFTAPEVDQETELAFRLTVTDNEGATGTSDTYVTVLDTDNGGGEEEQPSSQVLFASQYELKDGATGEPYTNSLENGDVYGFSGGSFVWAGSPTADQMRERQAYGLQFYHTEAIDENSYFGLTIKAPNNGAFDISESDTLVIQMGNGVSEDAAAFPNSHTIFTIDLNGGEQDTSDFSWTYSCSYDQELLEGSQPGDKFDPHEAWDNGWGIQTYRIPLADFDCGDGDLESLQLDLEEVAIKVVGGKDATASSTTTNGNGDPGNHTLLHFGYIAFSDDDEPVAGDSDHIIFASQYELKDGATGEPYTNSLENGDVYGFSGGSFVWAGSPTADQMRERQAYGLQFYHTEAIDENSYFGLTVKAPNNGALDISETDTLVIQMGNGVSEDAAAFPNSHTIFTIDLNGGEQDTSDFSWTYSCSYDQELLEGSQPGDKFDPHEAWDNGWGIQTYRIPLADFDCGDGDLESLQLDLEEVAIKVVGGKDATASSTTTNGNGDPGNHTLLHFGYIAFATDGSSTDGSEGSDDVAAN